jgi:hypothetical protein
MAFFFNAVLRLHKTLLGLWQKRLCEIAAQTSPKKSNNVIIYFESPVN